MDIRKQRERPSDETLENVRFIVAFRSRHAPPKPPQGTVETDPLGSLLYNQLIARLDALGIAVLYHKGKGLLDKEEKLHYRVTEHKVIRLEFVDRMTMGVVDGPRELASMGRYQPGGWEERLKEAYDECLRLSDQADSVAAVEDRLAKAESPEDVVALLDSAPDKEEMIKMLCLTPRRSSNAYTLYMSHILAERIPEAHHIIETAIELNPNDARLHLTLGNFYWAALSNAKGWGAGKDPGPLRLVTLDALQLPYEKARSLARTHYLEAMRLSTHREIEEEAGTQLSTLRS
jgi:tetratricopeptide (TPR) repeat protein